MKKIFSIIIAFVMMITLANAQTVESSRLFENTYVTLIGGGTTTGQFNQVPDPFFWDGAKGVAQGVRPFAGLEFGKYVTPVVGFSVEGLAFYNTTTSYTFIDESAVLANGKLNFSNWFGGYKGQPRRVEVVGVLGMGWGHDYTGNGQTVSSTPGEDLETVVGTNVYDGAPTIPTDRNYVVYNAGAELNINLGKVRAWQINVRPGVMWFNKYTKTQYQSLPRFMNDARANIQVGVTYKFGSKRKGGSHNFVLCPYEVTRADYDKVLAELEAEKNKPVQTKEIVKETVRTERVIEKETRVLVGSTIITFPIGSAVLSNVEKAKVAAFAKSLDKDTLVQIVGSADTKTGTETRNFALAQNRANVVKNILVNEYGVSADRISVDTKMDATGTVETDRSAILTLSVE
ncbi:MAG: OmpA family protein [Clostridia bacterium]|nr:OmpA family protein [Clostridia bacterium]